MHALNHIRKYIPVVLLLLAVQLHAQEPPAVKDTVIDGKNLKIDTSGRIFSKVEIRPKFNESFLKFLEKNLRYPVEAQLAGIQGTVIIEFTVNRDGTISDLAVAEQSPQKNILLVEEFMRILKLSNGKWRPGIQNGYVVTCRHMQPLNYVLAEEDDRPKKNIPPPPPEQGGTYIRIENGIEHVEVSPKFNGDLYEFIQKRLSYPRKTGKAAKECVILVEFTVDQDGNIPDMKIPERSPCKNKKASAEAMRVIKLSSGLWSPAKRDGKPVKSYHQQPVIFSL